MIKNPFSGKFITGEGTDGAGKATQLDLLQADIAKTNVNLVFTKEPTNDSLGWEIYDILNNRHKTLKLEEMSGLDMQRLYFQNRRTQYRNVILPCLRGGVSVMSDRGLVSVVFGIETRDDVKRFLDIERAMFLARDVQFIVPDLTLIYMVDPDVAVARLREKKRDLDLFETREMIAKVAERYRWAAELIPNCVLIDANRPADEVYADTRKQVLELLGVKI